MTKEDLLKPRYKVIADYPESQLSINSIIEHWMDSGYLSYTPYLCISHPEKYPAIFKKLEWWEEREEKDMPEYVVDKESSSVMYKVFGWENGNCQFYFAETKCYLTWTEYFLPATKEEYESQTNIQ